MQIVRLKHGRAAQQILIAHAAAIDVDFALVKQPVELGVITATGPRFDSKPGHMPHALRIAQHIQRRGLQLQAGKTQLPCR